MKSFLLTCSVLCSLAMSVIPGKPIEPTPREKFLAVCQGEVGVREATGKNDGEVDKYLAAVNLGGSRAPYCAAFNTWCGDQAFGRDGNPLPRSAWSPDHVRGGQRFTSGSPVRGGEAFGIWFSSKRRVAHTGILVSRAGSSVITIEGNTSATAAYGSDQDRDGHGVYRKIRPSTQIYSVRDWIGDSPAKR